MQTSWSKYFEQKQQERILLTTALMKNTHDMTEAEKIEYRKYARRRQQYDGTEKTKDPKDTKKNPVNQFQDKTKVTENSRVQPYPQTPKKTETSKNTETSENTEISKNMDTSKNTGTKNPKAKASPSPFEPEIRKVFPIYSHGKVCGYFYANENEVPPKKVALTNIGTAIKQTPNLQQYLKPVQLTQSQRRTPTPPGMGTLPTLVLSNIPPNNGPPVLASTTKSIAPSQTVNTLPLVMKPLHGMNSLKPLTMVPILPAAPVKFQHLIPATLQAGIKIQNNNLLCVTPNSNARNKTNIIPTFLQPTVYNINNNNNISGVTNNSISSCSQFITFKNQNGSSVLSSREKQMKESEIQNCKLKSPDEIKKEPESDDLCEENSEQQTESDIHQENWCISELPDSPPDLQIEIPDEEDKNSPDDKSEEEEEENDYGLVISSFYSLSKTNATELGIAFEN